MGNTKKAVLQKQIEGQIYELMVKTNVENIMLEDESTTLSAYLAGLALDRFITGEELDEKLKPILDLDPDLLKGLSDILHALDEMKAEIEQKIDKTDPDFLQSMNDFSNALEYNQTQVDWVNSKVEELKTEVSLKVDKQEGKGLSTEDFTTALKEKLEGLSNNSGGTEPVEGLAEHVADKNNPHSVDKKQVGLENVDNTNDEEKPLSSAARNALNEKAPNNHAANNATYGAGTTTVYGHVKLSDAIDSNLNAESGGTAATPSAVKKAYDRAQEAYDRASSDSSAKSVSVTLTTGGWTGSGPYTQTATVQGVTANNHLIVSLSPTASANQIKSAASAHILATLQTTNAVTFSAYNEKPTVDLPITLLLIG